MNKDCNLDASYSDNKSNFTEKTDSTNKSYLKNETNLKKTNFTPTINNHKTMFKIDTDKKATNHELYLSKHSRTSKNNNNFKAFDTNKSGENDSKSNLKSSFVTANSSNNNKDNQTNLNSNSINNNSCTIPKSNRKSIQVGAMNNSLKSGGANAIFNLQSINSVSNNATNKEKLDDKKLSPTKRKKKIIKHVADDPIEVDESVSEKEDWLYKFNSDEEFYKEFYKKFYKGFKKSNIEENRFTLSHSKVLSIEERKAIAMNYLSELTYEDLKDVIKTYQDKIEKQEEKTLIEYGKKNVIESNQFIFNFYKKQTKIVKKKVIKKTQIPIIKHTEYVLPKKPVILYSKETSFLIKELYDRDNRLYTKREMEKFRILKSHVCINKEGIQTFHPPGYLFETELIYKINKKHYNSIYNSEVNYHERCENTIFPLNKFKEFKLVDVNNVVDNNFKNNKYSFSSKINQKNYNKFEELVSNFRKENNSKSNKKVNFKDIINDKSIKIKKSEKDNKSYLSNQNYVDNRLTNSINKFTNNSMYNVHSTSSFMSPIKKYNNKSILHNKCYKHKTDNTNDDNINQEENKGEVSIYSNIKSIFDDDNTDGNLNKSPVLRNFNLSCQKKKSSKLEVVLSRKNKLDTKLKTSFKEHITLDSIKKESTCFKKKEFVDIVKSCKNFKSDVKLDYLLSRDNNINNNNNNNNIDYKHFSLSTLNYKNIDSNSNYNNNNASNLIENNTLYLDINNNINNNSTYSNKEDNNERPNSTKINDCKNQESLSYDYTNKKSSSIISNIDYNHFKLNNYFNNDLSYFDNLDSINNKCFNNNRYKTPIHSKNSLDIFNKLIKKSLLDTKTNRNNSLIQYNMANINTISNNSSPVNNQNNVSKTIDKNIEYNIKSNFNKKSINDKTDKKQNCEQLNSVNSKYNNSFNNIEEVDDNDINNSSRTNNNYNNNNKETKSNKSNNKYDKKTNIINIINNTSNDDSIKKTEYDNYNAFKQNFILKADNKNNYINLSNSDTIKNIHCNKSLELLSNKYNNTSKVSHKLDTNNYNINNDSNKYKINNKSINISLKDAFKVYIFGEESNIKLKCNDLKHNNYYTNKFKSKKNNFNSLDLNLVPSNDIPMKKNINFLDKFKK